MTDSPSCCEGSPHRAPLDARSVPGNGECLTPGLRSGTLRADTQEEDMGEPLDSRIRTIVSEQLGVAAEEVTSDASIIDDLGADSLDVVELVMALEESFDIEVPGARLKLLPC